MIYFGPNIPGLFFPHMADELHKQSQLPLVQDVETKSSENSK